jgi:hypothetical protein
VRKKWDAALAGIEPAFLAGLDFESSASSSSATGAGARRTAAIKNGVHAAVEGDDPLGGELGALAQRLEDAEDIVVGDRGALAARRRSRMRPDLLEARCLHGAIGSAERRRRKRASMSLIALTRDTVRQHVHAIKFYHVSWLAAACRDASRPLSGQTTQKKSPGQHVMRRDRSGLPFS